MGLSASTPVGALRDWHILKDEEVPKQKEPTPIRQSGEAYLPPRGRLTLAKNMKPAENTVAAWNFLRNNPLTRGQFRPIAHMLHPVAIGDQESERLEFYAGEIRSMLLFTRWSAPGPLDKENTVHAHGMKVLDNFHAFCALHVAANHAALETYREHQEGLPHLNYGTCPAS